MYAVIAALVGALAGGVVAGVVAFRVIGPTAQANAREAQAVAAYNEFFSAYGDFRVAGIVGDSKAQLAAAARFLTAKGLIAVFGSPEVFDAVAAVHGDPENTGPAMREVIRSMRKHIDTDDIDHEKLEALFSP